jgi:hypothetical protein
MRDSECRGQFTEPEMISTGILGAESCPFTKRKDWMSPAQVHFKVIAASKLLYKMGHFKITFNRPYFIF